jgi:hypothetical protein
MTKDTHDSIVQAIEQAWQQKDTKLLAPFLADELEWHEGVFEKPLVTKQAVLDCWEAEVPAQTDLRIQIKLLDFVENRGYHRCKASWQDKRGKHNVDAIFVIHINNEDKIIYFMPWYENKEEK